MSRSPAVILGNLDAEHRLAGETLSRSALGTASALATLLRVFAREGDRLWTPVPVDPERLREVPGLPRPELVSGPWEELEPAEEVLAWAEVPGVERLRAAPVEGTKPARRVGPEVVRRVLHRDFGFRVARELGVALPGARWLRSVRELHEHLDAGGAAASPTGGWVLKAPWSAAGRSRLVVPRAPEPGTEARIQTRAERLFARHGKLLFEPWMDRVADFGCTGVVGATDTAGNAGAARSVATLCCHRLRVDALGRFVGIDLGQPPLDPLLDTARQVAGSLEAEGYRGPFGIDAYLHRDREGREVLHPLGEINARLTFGHVARALAERMAERGELRTVRLRVGWEAPGPSAGCVSLLRPGDREERSPGAWLLGP